MERFNFKLEPILGYRERIEDLCKKEFSEASLMLREEEERLEVLSSEHRRAASEVDTLKEEGLSVGELQLYNDYLLRIKGHIEEQLQVVENGRKVLESHRLKLLQASQDKSVMEKMKERSFEEYTKRSLKEEQNTLDDMTSARFKGNNKD